MWLPHLSPFPYLETSQYLRGFRPLMDFQTKIMDRATHLGYFPSILNIFGLRWGLAIACACSCISSVAKQSARVRAQPSLNGNVVAAVLLEVSDLIMIWIWSLVCALCETTDERRNKQYVADFRSGLWLVFWADLWHVFWPSPWRE